eukprot:TRINITY_DN4146_c0_g1_i4.p1 TRINITY_DN4146_c0_g1~~TRINITY_DN4146_c0_g1_i4.p1  ORF type:complete len:443 (-),score=55.22 TRINITY_DN4146_c0_g1_i4:7-1278(-)
MSKTLRRVVVTGVGAVSPLATGAKKTWAKIIESKSGIRSLEKELSVFPSKVAATVIRGSGEDAFDLNQWVPAAIQSSTQPFVHFALAASQEALHDAKWLPATAEDQEATGVSIGSGIGSIQEIVSSGLTLQSKGYSKISPYFVPRILTNMAAGHVAIRHQLKGPMFSASSACATGCQAIGDAFRAIQNNQARVMVAGGTESSIDALSIAGFCRCRALSTSFNDSPGEASRPFDAKRDGFVIAEGAAALVLEDLEHALARSAPIYAEILGYGSAADCHHITSPEESGEGALRAMRATLKDAQIEPHQVDYINAHATSTPLGDAAENRAIKRLFGSHASKLALSSTKGAVGHLLGAAGALEAFFTVMTVRDDVLPPTLNLKYRSDEFDLNYVPLEAQRRTVRVALNNSFGFGGINACMAIGKYES